jgi:hypothetical protein
MCLPKSDLPRDLFRHRVVSGCGLPELMETVGLVMRRGSVVALVSLLAGAAPLRAQETPRPLAIKSRAVVFVVDHAGVEHRGRFLRADDQDVVVIVDGDEKRFARDTIAGIARQGDSLKNGAVIGAVIGTSIGLMGSLFTRNVGPLVAATAGWIGIGIGLDAAHQGRTHVYSGPTGATPQNPGSRRTSVQFSIEW